MIRMEYPKANIEGLTDREKIYALKKQLDTLTNNVQLVLESIDGDLEGINEYIGGVPDELDNSVSPISKRVDEVETAVGTLEERDYPVEQGTSGSWTYRKWNSGIIELWGAQSFTTRQGWDANDLIISFPFSIQRIISQDVSQTDYRIEVCYLTNATTTTIKLNAKASVAGTYGFTFRLVGRWK